MASDTVMQAVAYCRVQQRFEIRRSHTVSSLVSHVVVESARDDLSPLVCVSNRFRITMTTAITRSSQSLLVLPERRISLLPCPSLSSLHWSHRQRTARL
jgi:hypothetical protein